MPSSVSIPAIFLLLCFQSIFVEAFVVPFLSPPRCRQQQQRRRPYTAMPPQSEDSWTTAAELPRPITSATTTTSSSNTNIIAIRHGTSVSNEWMTGSNAWFSPTFCDDIAFVDSPLSEKGIQQAQQELPKQLQCVLDDDDDFSTNPMIDNDDDDDDMVVLVSPLTRCLQTWYYGVHPLLPSVRTIVVPLLRERVYSASDTGQPWGVLQAKWNAILGNDKTLLDWSCMQELYTKEDAWWYTVNVPNKDGHIPPAEWRPCTEQQYYAVPGEPEHVFRERMLELDEWLRRTFVGKTVVLVTHWGVLHHLTRKEVSNCGVCQWTLD